MKRTEIVVLNIILVIVMYTLTLPVQAYTTEVHVVKYASDKTTVLDETTVTYQWMEENLPVQGDGSTHYYFQGPIFEDAWENTYSLEYTGGDWGNSEEKWDRVDRGSGYVQEEQCNCYPNKDLGTCKGTDVRDLCNLVGGMSPGDEVKIKAIDGFYKMFPYSVIYNDEPALGPYVLTWYSMDAIEGGATSGYTGQDYTTGMRTMFFSDTSTNPWGEHITGIGDMANYIPEDYWHYYVNYPIFYPALGGYTVKYVSEIAIYSDESMLRGDANHDGRLSTEDSILALQMAVCGIDVDLVADMNLDGRVTSLDALMIIQAIHDPSPSPTLLWGPYITGTTTNSTIINWKTENATNGTLKYATEEYYTAHSDYDYIIRDTDNKQLHHLVITNLTPNMAYHYQLTIGNRPTSDYTFRTFPANGSFTFIVYGDTREQTGSFTQMERHKLVSDRISEEDNVSFVIHTGDFVCFGYNLDGWNDFFNAGRAMLANTTIYPVLGNHEYNHTNYYDAFGVLEWYSFDCGNAHFTILDSNDWADMTGQTEWLRDDIDSDATWKLVSFHHPPYSSDERHWGGWIHLRGYWEDIFINNSVDAVFNGHVHAYERYEENGLQYVILGCGGAPLYSLDEEKISGYQNSFEHTLGYARITIEGDNATMDVIKVADISKVDGNVTLHPPNTIFETVVLSS